MLDILEKGVATARGMADYIELRGEERILTYITYSDGRIDNVRKLLIYGSDVNAQTTDGKTALMLASEREHFNTIAILQAFDADEPSEEGSKEWELGFRIWSEAK